MKRTNSEDDSASKHELYGRNATLYVHGGTDPDAATGALLTPIYQTTTYVHESVDEYMSKGYSYSRMSNPTVRSLEIKIASLEGAADAACFSTGMSAFITVMTAFLKTGDHCIFPVCCYGGTFRAANLYLRRFGIDIDFVDFRSVENIRSVLKGNTKVIFCELPSNPNLWLTNLRALDDLAWDFERESRGEELVFDHPKTRGERTVERSVLLVCDSTLASPISVNPLTYGIDVVLHSATKYIDGHNITCGGVAASHLMSQHEKICMTRNIVGSIMEAQSAFYILAGISTLPLRYKQQSENAMQLATYLQGHPKVELVNYCGLDSYPQKELAQSYYQNKMFGGLLSFEIRGGKESAIKFMNCLGHPFSLCETFGSVQSLVTYPAKFTHSQYSEEERKAVGITDGLIRLSVGIENIEDIIGAVKKALNET